MPKFLESLSDEELKKEAKNESKNDALSAIVKSLKSLASTIPSQEENVRQLELFRLKMILRQLQISSFGGKMSALNEVNRVISSVWHYPNQGQVSVNHFLSADSCKLRASCRDLSSSVSVSVQSQESFLFLSPIVYLINRINLNFF